MSWAYIFAMQDGRTPLYIASQEGHVECVDMLLKNGANHVNQPDKVCSLCGISVAQAVTIVWHMLYWRW